MNTNKNWSITAREMVLEAVKRDQEVIFQLSCERAELRALVAQLYDGLADDWRTLPENAEAVKAAEAIHAQKTKAAK